MVTYATICKLHVNLRDGLSICEMWLYSYMRNGCVYIRIHSMRDVAVYRFIYARWCVYIYIHVCEIPHFTISIHSHCLNCHSMARMSFISALRSSCSNWSENRSLSRWIFCLCIQGHISVDDRCCWFNSRGIRLRHTLLRRSLIRPQKWIDLKVEAALARVF